MKVVVVGAGDIGIAAVISAKYVTSEVYLLEKEQNEVMKVKSEMTLTAIRGDATNPRTLKNALEKFGDIDVLISATKDDSMNLYICMNAKQIYGKRIRTIATIKNRSDLEDWIPDYVDHLLCPEDLINEKISKISALRNAVMYEPLSEPGLCLTTFKARYGQDIIAKTCMNLDLPKTCRIVAIYRGDNVILDVELTEIRDGDRILVIGDWESMVRFDDLMGSGGSTTNVVILGATAQGIRLAKNLSKNDNMRLKIMDEDLARCKAADAALPSVSVVQGNLLDPAFLRSENVIRANVVIPAFDNDEKNLLSCVTGIRFGVEKVVTRYRNEEYGDIFGYTGVESAIGLKKTVTNDINMHLVDENDPGRHNNGMILLERQGEFLLSVVMRHNCRALGKPLGNLALPDGVRICAVMNMDPEGNYIYAPISLKTVIGIGDKVMFYYYMTDYYELIQLFGLNIPEI
ncbi:MAG: NAD-binding protein [archaeon]|nr:NAD-binding protein [archaeon]